MKLSKIKILMVFLYSAFAFTFARICSIVFPLFTFFPSFYVLVVELIIIFVIPFAITKFTYSKISKTENKIEVTKSKQLTPKQRINFLESENLLLRSIIKQNGMISSEQLEPRQEVIMSNSTVVEKTIPKSLPKPVKILDPVLEI